MRHVPLLLLLAIYVLAAGQNWAVYISAIATAAYVRNSVRFFERVDSFGL